LHVACGPSTPSSSTSTSAQTPASTPARAAEEQDFGIWQTEDAPEREFAALRIAPETATEANAYYQAIRANLVNFPKATIAESAIGDMLSYYGFPAIPAEKLEALADLESPDLGRAVARLFSRTAKADAQARAALLHFVPTTRVRTRLCVRHVLLLPTAQRRHCRRISMCDRSLHTPNKRSKFHAADLFAGAGGAITGLQLAATAANLDLDLVAVNHWPDDSVA
jgi:hypothetical protein